MQTQVINQKPLYHIWKTGLGENTAAKRRELEEEGRVWTLWIKGWPEYVSDLTKEEIKNQLGVHDSCIHLIDKNTIVPVGTKK